MQLSIFQTIIICLGCIALVSRVLYLIIVKKEKITLSKILLFSIPISILCYLSVIIILNTFAFGVEVLPCKINSHANITKIINSPDHEGAKISKLKNEESVSWGIEYDAMRWVKYGKTSDIKRLASYFCPPKNYDSIKVSHGPYHQVVQFLESDHVIYTVYFDVSSD